MATSLNPWNNASAAYLQVGLLTSGMRFQDVNVPAGDGASYSGASRHICHIPRTDASVRWIWEVEESDIPVYPGRACKLEITYVPR